MAKSARFELRMDQDAKREIEQAASLSELSTSEFVYQAALAAARAVLHQDHVTTLPPDYFDQLMTALEAPAAANEPTRQAFQRLGCLLVVHAARHECSRG